MTDTDKQVKQIRGLRQRWLNDPLVWVSDNFPAVTLSTQQRDFFALLGRYLAAKIKRANGEAMTEEEAALSLKLGFSISAGQGVGKDFITAMVMFYILWVRPKGRNCLNEDKPRCIATGVNQKHLRNVLWSELSKIMLLSKPSEGTTILKELFEWRTDRLEYKADSRNRFAESATINKNASAEEQAATLYGRHAHTMLIVADEAADIPDCVFETMEGTMTGPLNFALMIFNPIRTQGYAIRSQTSGQYINLRWDAEESELVSRESIEEKRKKGEDSFTWRVRVKGLPPLVAQDSLIPIDWVLRAMDNHFPEEAYSHLPIKIGADVGGGGDKSVCCKRQGPKVHSFTYNSSPDTLVVTDWVAAEYREEEADAVIPDIVGIGHGVYYGLKRKKLNVFKGDAREQARDDKNFLNKRAEMAWKLREDFEADLIDLSSVKHTDDLMDQFAAIKFDPANKNKISSKKEIKKLLNGNSPDEFDALLLTYYVDDEKLTKGEGRARGRSFKEVAQAQGGVWVR